MEVDLLVFTVNANETRALVNAFKSATGEPLTTFTKGSRTYRNLGSVNGTRVVHALSEMGSSGVGAAQQAASIAIESLRPKAIVAVGVAFGIHPNKQSIGDILVSKQLVPYELQRVGKVLIRRGDKPHASARLINFFEGFAQTCWDVPRVHFGPLLTGDKLVDNLSFKESLVHFEPEAVGGDMEGAGIYASCHEHKCDWIVIKAICDWADGNKSENKQKYQELAAKNSVDFLVSALKQTNLSKLLGDHVGSLSHSRKPILQFIYEKRGGWRLSNIGSIPALDVVVAKKKFNGNWVHPVRIPPLGARDTRLLNWIGHQNVNILGARYKNPDGELFSVVCVHDNSKIFVGSKFPDWQDEQIGRHWN